MPVKVKFKKKREKESCIFYLGDRYRLTKMSPFCKITLYDTCSPDTCPWYKSQEMIEDSYETARKNHMKRTGRDTYFQNGYAPLHKEREDFADEYH